MNHSTTQLRHSLSAFLAVIVLMALGACSAPAPTGQAPDPTSTPPCDQPETVTDDPEMAASIEEILAPKGIRVRRAIASVHTFACPGAPEPVITRIDFEIDVTINDIAAPLMIAYPLQRTIVALDDIAPQVPGFVLMAFESTGQMESLRFLRDEGRSAVASGDVGFTLLSTLGYPPMQAAGSPCTQVWGKQPLPELSRLAREAFDREGLSDLDVSAAVNGRWCGDNFTAVQTEILVIVSVQSGRKSTSAARLGDETARVFDALLSLPPEAMEGESSPRIVVVEGWNIRRTMLITLDEARALQAQGLTGVDMFKAAGYR